LSHFRLINHLILRGLVIMNHNNLLFFLSHQFYSFFVRLTTLRYLHINVINIYLVQFLVNLTLKSAIFQFLFSLLIFIFRNFILFSKTEVSCIFSSRNHVRGKRFPFLQLLSFFKNSFNCTFDIKWFLKTLVNHLVNSVILDIFLKSLILK
jgi:hypothetical protein